MFALSQGPAMSMAFPDVCITPAVPPVPIPYPNIAMAATAVPNCPTILIQGMPAHNMGTMTPMTNGDNAGVMLGVASGLVMGPSRHLIGSFTTLFMNMPATRLSSMSLQNNTNAPGACITPSQALVLVLAP